MPALASCSTIWGGVPGLNPLPPAPFHRGRLLFTRISGAASNFLKRSRTVAYARDETESNRRGGPSGFRPMRCESDRRRSELNILDAKTEPMSVSPLMERGIILSEGGRTGKRWVPGLWRRESYERRLHPFKVVDSDRSPADWGRAGRPPPPISARHRQPAPPTPHRTQHSARQNRANVGFPAHGAGNHPFGARARVERWVPGLWRRESYEGRLHPFRVLDSDRPHRNRARAAATAPTVTVPGPPQPPPP